MPFAGNFAAHDGSLHSTLMHSWATAMLQFWPHNAAFNSRLFATVRALETQRRLLYGARHTEYSERTRSFSGMPLVFGVSMSQCPCASINRRPAAYAISPGSVFCTCYRTTSPSHSNWDNSTLTNWLSVISGTATVSVEADEECEMYDGGPDGRWDAEERHRGTCRALRMSPRRRRHTRRKLSVWVYRTTNHPACHTYVLLAGVPASRCPVPRRRGSDMEGWNLQWKPKGGLDQVFVV